MKPKFELLREEVNRLRQNPQDTKDEKQAPVPFNGAVIYTDFEDYRRMIMQDAKKHENK